MRIEYESKGEFTYDKFPDAESVLKWFRTNLDIEPCTLYGEEKGGWNVRWIRNQVFSPLPIK